jgi:predicted ArsR family transcriptional regulator
MTDVRETNAPATTDFDAHVGGLATLGEPVRRALYRFVSKAASPVSREQAASGVGVAFHTAKFHLDKLQEDGLLDVEFRRPAGRTGPGAGRPTKLYRRSSRELSVSLPERRYDLAGRIMAAAISASEAGSTPVGESLHRAADTVGRALGEEAQRRARPDLDRQRLEESAKHVLDDYGYEPREVDGTITLANCPFHALAQEYTALVCGMNLDLLGGMVGRLNCGLEACLDPAPGRCCVTIRRGT